MDQDSEVYEEIYYLRWALERLFETLKRGRNKRIVGTDQKEQFALGHGHLTASDRHLTRQRNQAHCPTVTPENRDPLGDDTFGTGFAFSSHNCK